MYLGAQIENAEWSLLFLSLYQYRGVIYSMTVWLKYLLIFFEFPMTYAIIVALNWKYCRFNLDKINCPHASWLRLHILDTFYHTCEAQCVIEYIVQCASFTAIFLDLLNIRSFIYAVIREIDCLELSKKISRTTQFISNI